MKKFILLGILALSTLALAGKYQDGTYRGNFSDSNETQVNVQFELKDDKIISSKYRYLGYKGNNFLKQPELEKGKKQYHAVLDFAQGKNVDEAMANMYDGDKIENAGASVRVTKVRSAIKDALLHDVYSHPKK
ncbi:MAG: hypothetical protein ACRCZ9_10585 [Fusobacteriaceae bacterium]